MSTFNATLPSSRRPIGPRPCEAMTIRSHPQVLAVSIMALSGSVSATWIVVDITPALSAFSLHAARTSLAHLEDSHVLDDCVLR